MTGFLDQDWVRVPRTPGRIEGAAARLLTAKAAGAVALAVAVTGFALYIVVTEPRP